MHPIRTWLCSIALLSSAAIMGQNNGIKARPSVLRENDRASGRMDTVPSVRNVFKLNPLLFFRGEAPLYYERVLSTRISLEVALGITFRNSVDLPGGDGRVDDFGAGTIIRNKASYHFGFRYYTANEVEPEGGYFQLGFAHVPYSREIALRDSNGAPGSIRWPDERSYNDIRLLFGYQTLGRNSNWVFDLYGGIGLRMRAIRRVDEHFDPTTEQWWYTQEEKNDAVPALFLGFKVGYGF